MMISKFRVCIDAGHGMDNTGKGKGFDPGAESGSYKEADIVLAYALTLKYFLNMAGIDTYLTRISNSESMPLTSRVHDAEGAGCTHLISLHLNEGGGEGSEAYYSDEAGRELCAKLLPAVISATGFKSRGVKEQHESQHSRLAILQGDMASCLIELGFIDNQADRTALLCYDTRVKAAREITSVFHSLHEGGA